VLVAIGYPAPHHSSSAYWLLKTTIVNVVGVASRVGNTLEKVWKSFLPENCHYWLGEYSYSSHLPSIFPRSHWRKKTDR